MKTLVVTPQEYRRLLQAEDTVDFAPEPLGSDASGKGLLGRLRTKSGKFWLVTAREKRGDGKRG